jgi:hypothetical protein
MSKRERDYARVYDRVCQAYAGGLAYGIDWTTLSEGWRQAFRRIGYHGPKIGWVSE